MDNRHAAFRAVLLGAAASLAAAGAATPDPVYQALRQATITESFVVENIVLKRDSGTLTLKSGTIGFTPPAMGRDTVAVFSGEGEFILTPVMQVEKTYLKSLTEQESVKESFDRALLCFTDDTGKEIRGQAKTKADTAKLGDTLRDFRKKLRNESPYNLEAALLADLYNPGQPGFFSAYVHGRKHGELQYHVKPRGAEPGLGPEEVMLVNVQPVNVPDEIWYHSHLQNEFTKQTASSDEEHSTVQAESYKIETAIARNDHFTATATLRVKACTAGDRVIALGLVPTLRVSKVTAGGAEIAFIQEDKKEDAALSVVLPQPMEKGSAYEIVLEYAGDKVVRKEGGGNFAVGARESWYPNVNTFHDHALYDLTFRVPKQYTLVSVGKLEKEWTEKDVACTHWISGAPLAVAGFNYGTFKKKVSADPKVGAIEGYATSDVPDYLAGAESLGAMGKISASSLMEQTMIEAQNALRIFSAWFGKSEFDRIAITQQPDFSFGQSWPSLVYLPMSAFLDSTQRFRLMQAMESNPRAMAGMNQFIDEVTAHEVSHQWWGHMVGWSTYHDHWLSEGFADFSAGLYLQLTEKNPDKYLRYWEHARQALVEKNAYGRRANDAGPIWLGLRLSSEKNAGAYSRVVYNKGGFVLHMLRQMMFDARKGGDQQFIDMMQDFVRQHMNRNATTERFQRIVEKHMTPGMNVTGDGRMDWFFGEWVYGTALPKYNIDYTVTAQDEGKFLLKGSITQSEVPPGFVMLVPIYMEIDGVVQRLGSARMVGSATMPVEVMLPKKPKRVMLNYYHDVLEQ